MTLPRLASLLLLGSSLLCAADAAAPYRDQLKSLDASRPESVCTARTVLRERMPQANAADRAAMFRAFRAFYRDSLQSSAPRFATVMARFSGDIATLRRDPDVLRAAAPWLDCGFSFDQAEGDLYPEQDSATLLEFVPLLPPDLAGYLRFRAREDAQPVGGDASLALSWEERRERLARWEGFARQNRSLPETGSEVWPAIRILAENYFFGEDNTPSFDRQTGRILPDLAASWGRLATRNRESYYQKVAADLSIRLRQHDGKITQPDRDLFVSFGMADAFDNWWRYVEAHLKIKF